MLEAALEVVSAEKEVAFQGIGEVFGYFDRVAVYFPAGFVEVVDGFVGGDAVHPGVELGGGAEIGQSLPYFDECVLEDVIGVFVAEDDFRMCQ